MREKNIHALTLWAMQLLAISVVHNATTVKFRPTVFTHMGMDVITKIKTTNFLLFFHFSAAVFNTYANIKF